MILNPDGKIDKRGLRSILKRFEPIFQKVIIPAGRLSIKIKPFDINNVLADTIKKYDESLAIESLSILEKNSVLVELEPIPYRIEYIANAWNELISRSYGHWIGMINITSLDAVTVFKTQLGLELSRRMKDPTFNDNKVLGIPLVEIIPHKDNPLAGQELIIKISIQLRHLIS